MTVKDWLTKRIPTYALEEIDAKGFLEEQELSEEDALTEQNKHKLYRAYVHVLKKLYLSFYNVSEEGISISLPWEFIKAELKLYGSYIDDENFLGLPDIINAGEWT